MLEAVADSPLSSELHRSLRLTVILPMCLILSCAGTPPVRRAETTLTCLTREWRVVNSNGYVETHRHDAAVSDRKALRLLSLYPELRMGLLESDCRFLLIAIEDEVLFEQLLKGKRMVSSIEGRLETRDHVFSTADPRSDYGETEDQVHLLNPVDQLKVHLLLEALDVPGMTGQIGELLLADLEDIDSEHGGVVVSTPSGTVRFLSFPSRASDDHQYAPLSDTALSGQLALWHSHASRDPSASSADVDNSAMAGPTGSLKGSLVSVGGDLWTFYIRGEDGVILTPTGSGTFNADFVSSEGIGLDLGKYSFKAE